MSTNWTDPSGDDPAQHTGEQPPGGSPQDAPVPPPHPPAAGPAYPGQPYPSQPYPSQSYPSQPYSGWDSPPNGPGPGGPYLSPVAPRTGSAVTLLVLSGLLTMVGCGLGIPSLVMSIVALARGAREGAAANRVLRAGWITFGVLATIVVVFWAIWISVLTSGSMRR